MGERRGTKGLELWCKKMTEGYPGVKIDNMTTSWRDGLAFCAMIHHFRPELIDFAKLNKDDVYRNNELAFRVAEQYLGIPALLDAEDMVEYAVPDRLSILTYLSQFYQAFEVTRGSASRVVPKRPATVPDRGIVSPASTSPPTKMTIRGRASEGLPPRKPCDKCGLPVFIGERLTVGKLLFHRTCFRCARCDNRLTPANYYETETNKFCCETCPDEIAAAESLTSRSISDEEKSILKESTMYKTALEFPEFEVSDSISESEFVKARSFFMNTQLEDSPPTLPKSKPPESVNRKNNSEVLSIDLTVSVNSNVKKENISTKEEVATDSSCIIIEDSTGDSSCVFIDDPPAPTPNDKKQIQLNFDDNKPQQLKTIDKDKPPDDTNSDINDFDNKSLDDVSTDLEIVASDVEPEVRKEKIPKPVETSRPSSVIPGEEILDFQKIISNLKPVKRKSLERKEIKKESPVETEQKQYEYVIDERMDVEELNVCPKIEITPAETKLMEELNVETRSTDETKVETEQSRFKEESESTIPEESTCSIPEDLSSMEESNYSISEEPKSRMVEDPKYILVEESEHGVVEESEHGLIKEPEHKLLEEPDVRIPEKPKSRILEDTKCGLPEPTFKIPEEPKGRIQEEPRIPEKPKARTRHESKSVIPEEPKTRKPEEPMSKLSEKSKCKAPEELKPKVPPKPILTESQDISLVDSVVKREEYPEDLNPFDDDVLEESLNPFDDDVDDEEEVFRPQPKPRAKKISGDFKSSPVKDAAESTNPFGEDEDEDDSNNPFGDDDDDEIEEEPKKEVPKVAPRELNKSKNSELDVDGRKEQGGLRLIHPPSFRWSETLSDESDFLSSPFDSDDEDTASNPKNSDPPEPKPRSSGHSILSEASYSSNASSGASSTAPSLRKKKAAPRPPIPFDKQGESPRPSTSLQASPSPRSRKVRRAPLPPHPTSTPLHNNAVFLDNSFNTSPIVDNSTLKMSTATSVQISRTLLEPTDKSAKDETNRHRQTEANISYSLSAPNKSTYGKWKRKKGQAPLRPVPIMREVKPLPMIELRNELDTIEIQLQGLGKQTVRLEEIIRDKCEGPDTDPDSPISEEAEDLIIQMFELINEKNELVRRQAELMYLQRQQRLEREHAEVEYEIRCLMLQPEENKTDFDKEREEELINRLVDIVERRNEVIECLEMDRRRAAEEDRSINSSMNSYTSKADESLSPNSKEIKKKKKFKNKFKLKGSPKVEKIDADKDVDESEATNVVSNKVKKKKFNLF